MGIEQDTRYPEERSDICYGIYKFGYLIFFDKLLKEGHLSFAYFTELFNYDQFAENVPDSFLPAILTVGPGLFLS